MHRWFYANSKSFCKSTSHALSQPATPTATTGDTNWIFKVQFDWQLCANEFFAIGGSCPSLGNWNLQHSLALKRIDNSAIWTLTVPLSGKQDVYYRYLVYATNGRGKKIVRFWETHFEPRMIRHGQLQDIESIETETFGFWNNKLKIERGWLNANVTVVQFKFYEAPFVYHASQGVSLLQVKITPIKVRETKKCDDDKLRNLIASNGTEDEYPSPTFAFCEVASLQNVDGEFRKLPKYGTPCGPDHIIMFNLTLDNQDQTAYLIDLYNWSSKSASEMPLSHFGYQYVLPEQLKNSEGTLQLNIMCGTKHRPIGSMKCDYLVVKPMHMSDFNLEKTFQRHWNTKHEGTYIGHRGCGNSFWLGTDILRENTIDSLNLAIQHKADMVEFDVQLTKDKIPVLWHDFQLCVTTKSNNDAQENDIMQLPLTTTEIDSLESSGEIPEKENNMFNFLLSKFTLEQLKRVRVYEPPDDEVPDAKNNRPFSTLEQVLKEIDNKTGFIIDIKWLQKVIDDTEQDAVLQPSIDKNEFVDIIINVVLRHAGSRRIVFSSFDADVCTMIRLKQNLYPTLFIIQPCGNEKKFIDPRGEIVATGIYFAYAMELLGICINCSDILEIPGNVCDLHDRDLCIYSWGIETRTEETRKYLRKLGVDGIICDRLNGALQSMDLKENLFNIVPFGKPLERNELSENAGAKR